MSTEHASLTSPLLERVHEAIAQAGGWLPFDRFMALALYAPGLGYYTNALQKFGAMPESGSDFVTAPGLSPLFGQTLAQQVAQARRVGVGIAELRIDQFARVDESYVLAQARRLHGLPHLQPP